MSSTISSKGQITVPKAVREALGLKSGDAVEFVVREGQVVMRPARVWTLDEFVGCLKEYAPKTPRSMKEERALLVKTMGPHMKGKFLKGKR
jgi:AbrB family looped-hinge helix DNA binding protein